MKLRNTIFYVFREQRVTHVLIFLMIGMSVMITPILRHIPMPVLYGVFLYMGVASLKGLQFFERMLIVFMPVKYQPDHMYLRQVSIYFAIQFFTSRKVWFCVSPCAGTFKTSAFIHCDPVSLLNNALGGQIFQANVNFVPSNGRYNIR